MRSRADKEERCAMIKTEARRAQESKRQSRAVEIGTHGAWATWNTLARKLIRVDIWNI
ncbi:hypothetical protein DPMN_057379 [Dreissena polymorpha]|uniref:Uncharacterized protein n=1 Tax=Dreissena polymorpha TaxID=45954 RepID=A0A9D4BZV8_DREPO|nr:hypothetical protein DPMN_057379 [Dreissena polymorpha]